MLESLLSDMGTAEKKRILTEEYGMVMTMELEGRIWAMCNLSENIEERGIEKGILKERLAAIQRMLKANATKEQIISYGYTESEYAEAEDSLYANV